MAKQNFELFRLFSTNTKDLMFFGLTPNVPPIIAKISYTVTNTKEVERNGVLHKSYDVAFEFDSLQICQAGLKNFESVIPYVISRVYNIDIDNFTFNYHTISISDTAHAPDLIVSLGSPTLVGDITSAFSKLVSSKRFANWKSIPKTTSFYNMPFSKFLSESFSYQIPDNKVSLPPNSLKTISYNTEDYWSHPLIASDPEKFKPDIDQDLVDVIKETSPDYAWAMNYLTHLDPTNPNKNILFIGPAGVGKSETVRAIARVLNLPYAEFTFTRTSEFADAAGKITATSSEEQKDWIFKQTEVASVLQSGGIVNLEEITAMIESHQIEGNNIIAGLNRYLYSNGHKITVHPNVIFFGTMNVAYGGLSRLQTAFASRWKRRNYEQPSSDIVAKYYVKKYKDSVSPDIIVPLVELTFKVGEVLSMNPSFSKDDPHFGPAPAVHNRNRRELIFDLLSNTDKSISDVIRNFIQQQIHTNYFPKELVDKVVGEINVHIESLENILSEQSGEQIVFSFEEQPTPVEPAQPKFKVEL
jgi:DNA polymerase III delta prime subunit